MRNLIQQSLNGHINAFQTRYPNLATTIIGNFVYGSQNYGLSTSGSDVDSILIYEGEPIRGLRHSSIRVGIEDIKLFTIDNFCKRLERLYLPALEVFCTNYKNMQISDTSSIFDNFKINDLCDNARDLLLINLSRKLAEHTYEINHLAFLSERPDNLPYNKKRLYWAMRVYDQIVRIQNGEHFSQTLIPSNRELLLEVKTGVEMPIQNVVDFRNEAFTKLKELRGLKPSVSDKNKLIINDFKEQLIKVIR